MRQTTEMLVVGGLSAAVAVGLLLLIEVSLVLAVAGTLGAAIPVSMVYAMVTLDTTSSENSHSEL